MNCGGLANSSGRSSYQLIEFPKFSLGYSVVKHSWMKVSFRLTRVFFTKQRLSAEHIQHEGPPQQRYGLACSSFASVILTVRSSCCFPPSLRLLHGRGSPLLPCAALFVCLIVGKFLHCPWESSALWAAFSLGVLHACGVRAQPLLQGPPPPSNP